MSLRSSPGGTPGGLTEFIGGGVLCAVSFWMLSSRVMVHGGRLFGGMIGDFGGGGGFAALLIPFVAGVVLLFRDGASRWGWVLVGLGLALIALDVITSLQLTFMATPLPQFLLMVGSLAAGVGLILRSLRDHDAPRRPQR